MFVKPFAAESWLDHDFIANGAGENLRAISVLLLYFFANVGVDVKVGGVSERDAGEVSPLLA